MANVPLPPRWERLGEGTLADPRLAQDAVKSGLAG